MLLAAKADENEFRELERIVDNDNCKRECREALQERNEKLAQSDEAVLKTINEPGFALGLSLEELHRLLPKAKTPAQRFVIYWRTSGELETLGDYEGRDAWEEKILRDFKDDPNACATVFLDRGTRACRAKDWTKALEIFRRICRDYRKSDAWPEAQRQIGVILQRQKKYDEAIAAYRELMPDKTKKVDADFLEAGRITRCYETKGDFVSALEWVQAIETAHDNQPVIGCLNCYIGVKASLTLRKATLLEKLGRSDEALKLLETEVFENECDDAAFLLVDIYHRRGQLEKLDMKLADAKKSNLVAHEKECEKDPSLRDPSFDGVTDSMKVANAYLAIRRMTDKGDMDGLWAIIEKSEDNAFGAFVQLPGWPAPSWQVTKALAALDTMGEKPVPFLRKQLDGSPRSQGWAAVLLARRKATDLLPKLKRACDVMDKMKPADVTAQRKRTAAQPVIDERTLDDVRQDLLYALALLDTKEAKDVLNGYLTRNNGDNGFGGSSDPMSDAAEGVLRNLESANSLAKDENADD
jgi:tetratricopeptide (TPR) repeat protein